jgi:tetratricopeptide (TPR) repeat protein
MIPGSRAPAVALLLMLLGGRSLGATQCPDGAPPPCVRAAQPAVRTPVDENVVAIFPFRVTGSSADAATLREGAMDLLQLALDEQAGWRAVPSRTLLARSRGFGDATSVADAAQMARSLGAGSMILSTAVVIGGQVRARAELHDLVRNRPAQSVEARGSTADPSPVIDSLAFQLARLRLTSGSGTALRSLAEFATTSPIALRLYLAGERLARQGRWQESADSLQRAIAADSTFGLAYYRLRIASTFGASVENVNGVLMAALRYESRLPRRQREMLSATWALVEGRVAAALSLGEALGTRYPDDPEVGYVEGEAYWHLGLPRGETPERAARPFLRAIALDSSFLDPYNHAVEMLMVLGDTANAWRLARRALVQAPTSAIHQSVLLALRAIRGEDPASMPATDPERAGRAGLEVVRMLPADPARALELDERLQLRSLTPASSRNDRRRVTVLVATIRAAQGRLREADSLLRAVHDLDPGAIDQVQAEAFVAGLRGVPAPAQFALLAGRAADPNSLALAGWLVVRARDSAAVRAIARRLSALTPPDSVVAAALARGLEGLLAQAESDSARALAPLRQSWEVHPGGGAGQMVAEFGFALARLERDMGDWDGAMRRLAAARYAQGVVFVRRAESEELRGQIAMQHGDSATAREAYRTFVSLWELADPEFQPRVEAARAALARLGPS